MEIKFDPTDISLALANVLIALHRTRQIDLGLMLPELGLVTEKLWHSTAKDPKARSTTSRRLHQILTGPLRSEWDPAAPPAAP